MGTPASVSPQAWPVVIVDVQSHGSPGAPMMQARGEHTSVVVPALSSWVAWLAARSAPRPTMLAPTKPMRPFFIPGPFPPAAAASGDGLGLALALGLGVGPGAGV